jgi:hypothetical protein
MASKTLCTRSTVIPWYSLRSSRETWASLTPSFSANSLWLRPLAILKAMSRVPTALRSRTHPLVPLHLFLELGAEREHRLQGSVYLLLGESQPFELLLYPRWQFGADGEILAGLQGVISAAREAGMGPEELHFFVTEPEERLGGALPLDLLRRGEGGGPPALGRLGTVLG